MLFRCDYTQPTLCYRKFEAVFAGPKFANAGRMNRHFLSSKIRADQEELPPLISGVEETRKSFLLCQMAHRRGESNRGRTQDLVGSS